MPSPLDEKPVFALHILRARYDFESNLLLGRASAFLGANSVLFAVASIGDAPIPQRSIICALGIFLTGVWLNLMKRSDKALAWLKDEFARTRDAGYPDQLPDEIEADRMHNALLDSLGRRPRPSRGTMTRFLPVVMLIAWFVLIATFFLFKKG